MGHPTWGEGKTTSVGLWQGSVVAGDEEEEGEDEQGDDDQGGDEEVAVGGRGLLALPGGGFGAVGDSDLVLVLQVVGELAGAGVAVFWIALEGAVEDLLQLRRDGWLERAGRRGIVEQAVVHDGEGVGSGEGNGPGEHLVEHDAEGVDVAARVSALSADLLGRDVVGRAEALGEVAEGEAAGAGVGGDAEVDEADVVVVVDHDVLGLHVAVDDAVGVDVLQRAADADGELDGAVDGEPGLLLNDLAEKAAGDPLHDHVDLGAAGVGEDLHDGGMMQAGADVCLALEALVEGGVALDLGVGDLYGDLRAGARVGGAEDGGHAAGGHQLFEAVVVELVAGVNGEVGSEHLEQPVRASTVKTHALY